MFVANGECSLLHEWSLVSPPENEVEEPRVCCIDKMFSGPCHSGGLKALHRDVHVQHRTIQGTGWIHQQWTNFQCKHN